MLPVLRVTLVALLALVAACTKPAVWASDADVIAARYVHPGPASITLFNIINNENGQGDHAALMINASQRVLFDPAGSWQHPRAPERHDVHFGFDDRMLFLYTYYHARHTHHMRVLHLEVSPQTAERLLTLAQQAGPVRDAHCARSIGQLFRQVPELSHMPVVFQPNRLSNAFATLPGVREEIIRSDALPTELQTYSD